MNGELLFTKAQNIRGHLLKLVGDGFKTARRKYWFIKPVNMWSSLLQEVVEANSRARFKKGTG